jgi:alpha,alpha-trehalose phosphorylase
VTFKISGRQGAPIRITKYLSYHYSDSGDGNEIRAQTGWTLDRAKNEGVDRALAAQAAIVERFWERSDVVVDCPSRPRQQQLVRWNLFQLLQASGRAEGHGIGARGLTGRTYEGHYFWDTEIYVLPFLIYTHRERARSILGHRYHQLGKARARAAELGHKGATFPWRTINGDEASAYYAAGTAQYHINADIAYTVRKYVEVTGDTDFMHRYGAEILVETARFWCDLGFVSNRDGKFHIHGVTGPDEYTAVVNDNYFTNLMAQENLTFAADVVDRLADEAPDVHHRLQQATGLAPDEAAAWRDAGRRMYLPVDKHTNIHPQDADFLSKRPWDLANTPPDDFPLLLHYHPLNLYRHQVIKQADVLLAMFLISDHFSTEEMKRNFDYYDPLTTHDSSLSVCIQSIIAAEIGYLDKAKEYFDFALSMDLGDVGGNMMQGAHIASIGGTWLALVYGFGGMRDRGGEISFRPRLPKEWRRLRFPLTVRGSRFTVDITAEETTYTLQTGDGLSLAHRDEPLHLTPAAPIVHRP